MRRGWPSVRMVSEASVVSSVRTRSATSIRSAIRSTARLITIS